MLGMSEDLTEHLQPSPDSLAARLMRVAAGAGTAGMSGEQASEDGLGLDWASVLPWERQIVVADANALASACVAAARGKRVNILTIIASRRGCVVVAGHVPGEILPAIGEIARDQELADRAAQVWYDQLAPCVRVVDLPIGEMLRPEIAVVRHGVGAVKADVDDLPSAALAAFLAPTVIWSADRIFTDTGLAARAHDTADALATLMAAESATATTAMMTFVGSRLIGAAGLAVTRTAARNPRVALAAVMGGAALAAIGGANRRALALARGEGLLRGVGGLAKLLMLAFCDLQTYREHATADLRPYDAPTWRARTACETAARILALSITPLTVAEIMDKINYNDAPGWPQTVSGLNDLLEAHPAFTGVPGAHWQLGALASDYFFAPEAGAEAETRLSP